MCCGPITAPSISPPLWRNMRGGSGASGLALADQGSRWSDLNKRVLSAVVLLPVALFCVWAGGYPFLLLVAAGCALTAHEWVTLCGYASPDPPVFWMPGVIVVAALCAGLGQAGVGLLVVLAGMVAALFLQGRRRADLAFGFP